MPKLRPSGDGRWIVVPDGAFDEEESTDFEIILDPESLVEDPAEEPKSRIIIPGGI